MKFRKWIAAALALCMMLPTVATAVDVETEPESVVLGSGYLENPYGTHVSSGIMTVDLDEIPTAEDIDVVSPTYDSVDDAAETLLTGMKNRDSEITIYVTSDVYTTLENTAAETEGMDVCKVLFQTATTHNINDPKGGDYTGLLYDQMSLGYGFNVKDGVKAYYLQFNPTYRTTKEQEDAVDAKVDTLVTAWKTQNLNDYKIIQTIYNYITANVAYDNEGLNDETDLLKYTAYGALCEGSAVCMGISLLFYRLALEMGVDARFIQSIEEGDHAWNIVKLGGVYYNVDATWDLDENGYESDKWFLKNMTDFQETGDKADCHVRAEQYLTDAFTKAYPMATKSYGYGSSSANSAEVDRGNIAFQIPHIGVDTTDWTPDCVWEEGEYAEIDVKRTWISTAVNDKDNLDTAKNLPLKLGMSWDDEYIYTFLQFTDPDGHINTWGSEPSRMWLAGSIQVGYAEADATGTDLLEYGIARTSDTDELISNVWLGYGYIPTTKNFNVQVGEDNLMTYEFRTPIAGFSNVAAAAGVTYGACYVLCWGNGQDFAHTQLGSGISGDAGKEAGNFMKVTLSDTVLDDGTWKDLEWEYDTDTKTLTIRGEGAIPYRADSGTYPWSEYKAVAEHVVIEEGITEIPYGVLYGFKNVQTLALPSTLTDVSDVNFNDYLFNLQSITVTPGGKYYSVDGVLFSNVDGYRSLMEYPRGKTDTYYAVPDDVQSIEDHAFFCIGSLKELFIPKSVELIQKNAIAFNSLTAITVDSESTYYTSVDGVLYSKDMTVLHTYPGRSTMTTFTVPDTVKEMTYNVLTMSSSLKQVYIPASVETIWEIRNISSGCATEEIHVAEDNPNYCSVDGVLYSKDMRTLCLYPSGKTDTEYTIPDTVESIAHGALWVQHQLKTLYISENVENVANSLLYISSSITSIYFPGDFPSWFYNAFTMWKKNYEDQLNRVTFYYPVGASGWTSPTMTINGVTYKTASYNPNGADIPWNTWNNIQWYYDEDTKTLTIGGEGAIPQSTESDPYPWDEYKDELEHVVIEEGITEIWYGALYDFTKMQTVALPSTLTNVSAGIFNNYSPNLQSITVTPGGKYYSEDGVLFSNVDDYRTLLVYPRSKQNTAYTVPDNVQAIKSGALINNLMINEFTISASVEHIDENAIVHNYNMKAIHVDAENTKYTSVDGVLYNKDMTVLHAYPYASPMTTFTIPDTVKEMTCHIFTSIKNLNELYIPASVETIWNIQNYSGPCNVGVINVAEDNANYCSIDGVLYSKDMTWLYQYPKQKSDTVYTIPDAVRWIVWANFRYAMNLTTLYMNKNIEFNYNNALGDITNITSIYFPGDLPAYFTNAFSNVADKVTFYYPTGATGWTSPTMELNGVTYKTASYTKYTAGDLTGDGDIDADDLSLLQDYFSGNTTATFDTTKADFNGDGKFTRADVMYLARALAGWEGYKIS